VGNAAVAASVTEQSASAQDEQSQSSTGTQSTQPQAGTASPKTSGGGQTRQVVDSNALIRGPGPDFASTGERIPVGTMVEILEQATGSNSKTYARVKGEDGTELGWTATDNLGSSKELDPTMAADAPIDLNGLAGLDRNMAVLHNTRGKYLASEASTMRVKEMDAAAVLQVESGGQGFSADDRMIIRFENHIFWKEWGKSNAATFQQHFKTRSGNTSWKGHKWRRSASDSWQDFHGNQGSEWEVFEFASGLDAEAAALSISMGAAQIMGFNHATCGYKSAREMFEAMNGGIKPQLEGMFQFIQKNPTALSGLRSGDYVKFAGAYNGSGQANAYGAKIRSAAQSYDRVVGKK